MADLAARTVQRLLRLVVVVLTGAAVVRGGAYAIHGLIDDDPTQHMAGTAFAIAMLCMGERAMNHWKLLIALACLCLIAPPAARANDPKWIDVPPVRQFANARLGAKLCDIESQMPAGHIYRDNDLVTWAHETTHGINSRIRNTLAKGTSHANGFYVLANRGIVLPEPRCRKSHAARFIPAEYRDSTYSLYVAGQSAWDAEPLYVFDEWIAYTNGTEVGIELAEKGLWSGGQRSETTENMLEFCVFAGAVIRAVQTHDASYAEFDKLVQFTRWNIDRSLRLADDAEKYPAFITARARQMRDAIRAVHEQTPKPRPLPMLAKWRRAVPLMREGER